MKPELAFKLIGEQLGWSDAQFAGEFRELQLMIDHKYDRYHGYQPATRFHVSLLNWLSQFADIEQRKIVYRLLKERLIYVSQVEMHHLVSMLMPIVERHARRRVAAELEMPLFETWDNEAAERRFKLMNMRTLYVGLSDGARMDVFRRYNEGRVSNEQVVASNEVSDEKWKSMQEKLCKRLKRESIDAPARFEVVCLIDDFSGSGSTLLRRENDGSWDGKVAKFYKANIKKIGNELESNCVLHVHHHLASAKAKSNIESTLLEFSNDNPGFKYVDTYSYVLPESIVIGDSDLDVSLVSLIKEWYDKGIEDDNTGKNIWYGYKQGGLPLVLEHNTPNNSVALLWASSGAEGKPQMKPLFVRRKRHSSHG